MLLHWWNVAPSSLMHDLLLHQCTQLTAAKNSLALAQSKLASIEHVAKEKEDLKQQIQTLEAENSEANKEVCRS